MCQCDWVVVIFTPFTSYLQIPVPSASIMWLTARIRILSSKECLSSILSIPVCKRRKGKGREGLIWLTGRSSRQKPMEKCCSLAGFQAHIPLTYTAQTHLPKYSTTRSELRLASQLAIFKNASQILPWANMI